MASPVIEAIMMSSRDALLDALHRGGNANETEDGNSALVWACLQDREDLASDLLRNGADVNAAGSDGTTPLFIAVMIESIGLTTLLLKAGASTEPKNEIGQTPLMVAAKTGCEDILSALIDAGASATALDAAERNAMHWAITDGDFPEVVERLLAAGTNPRQRSKEGLTPLDYAKDLGRVRALSMLAKVY